MSSLAIAGYALVYAVIHGWLASQRMKDWTRRIVGPAADRWYRLAYNALATLMLLPFVALFALLPDQVLYVFPPPWLYLALIIQAVAAIGVVYGVWITDAWHFLGIRQLLDANCPPPCRPPLSVYGLYRWVRHPLYFLGLVFMWASPRMSINTATLFAVFSLYLYVGSIFEERRLVAEYGAAYRHYQRQVPRLFPWRGPVKVILPDDQEKTS